MSGFPLCGRLIALVTAAFAVSACSTPTAPSTEATKAKAALDAATKAPTNEGAAHRRRDRPGWDWRPTLLHGPPWLRWLTH